MARAEKQVGNGRVLYFDLLKIIAMLGVMLLHVSGQNWANVSVTSREFQIFNFFDGIARCSVPLFVMISGALFLGVSRKISVIYKKNILRIVTAFVFWSAAYALISLIQGADIKSACVQFVTGHYHMWFMFMIVGLYMIVPFLAKIVESKHLTLYFLILTFIIALALPKTVELAGHFFPSAALTADSVLKNLNFISCAGYVFYFVLGYYLANADISKKVRIIIYILGLLGFVGTVVLTSVFSVFTNTPETLFYSYFSVNVFLESLGVFVLFKYAVGSSALRPKIGDFIGKMAKYSFGAYLVHPMIIELLKKRIRNQYYFL